MKKFIYIFFTVFTSTLLAKFINFHNKKLSNNLDTTFKYILTDWYYWEGKAVL